MGPTTTRIPTFVSSRKRRARSARIFRLRMMENANLDTTQVRSARKSIIMLIALPLESLAADHDGSRVAILPKFDALH